jgi:glycosyltransferase involved in cell wall biosynthesis
MDFFERRNQVPAFPSVSRHPSWRRKFRPRLWDLRQYTSRRVRIPADYQLEEAPDNPPRIAIVTPSFNQGRFIAATVDSVLKQNYPNLAYFVQDGGSTDETTKVLKSYGSRLRWRSEPDAGQGNAINRGFHEIDGDIMAYLNSDDTLLPGTLAYVARFFHENSNIDLIYGHRVYVDRHGLDIGRCVLPPHDPEALKWADYIPQETFFGAGAFGKPSALLMRVSSSRSIGISSCERKQRDFASEESLVSSAAFGCIITRKEFPCSISVRTR